MTNIMFPSDELLALSASDPTSVRARFREALSRVGSSVVAITADLGTDGPVGMTVGTFTSISMEPPLVGFFAGRASSTLPKVLRAGSFCANVLSRDQYQLARAFSRSGKDRFDEVQWSAGPSGSPFLTGAHAWIECTVTESRAIGDHDLVVGQVDSFYVPFDTEPLIFHNSTFHELRAHE